MAQPLLDGCHPVELPGRKDQTCPPGPLGCDRLSFQRDFQIAASIAGGVGELDDNRKLAESRRPGADILMPAIMRAPAPICRKLKGFAETHERKLEGILVHLGGDPLQPVEDEIALRPRRNLGDVRLAFGLGWNPGRRPHQPTGALGLACSNIDDAIAFGGREQVCRRR